jgi:hypothetical protein
VKTVPDLPDNSGIPEPEEVPEEWLDEPEDEEEEDDE